MASVKQTSFQVTFTMKTLPIKTSKSVNDALNPILMVSKLAAVCTITRDASKKEFVVSYLLVIFQIAVSIVSIAHLAFIPYGVIHLEKLSQNDENMLESDRNLSNQSFITKMSNIVLISVTAIAVRVSSLLQMHKILPSMLKTIAMLDRSLDMRKDRDALWILIFSVILILISWPYQLYSIIMVTTNNWMALVIFSLNLYNNFSIISCEFQFISLCWIVKTRFSSLNQELRELSLAIVVNSEESILHDVNRIKRAYKVLNEISGQLNSLYSFQLLTILASLSLCVLFNLYFAIFGGFKRDSASMASEAKQVSGAMNDSIWSLYYFGRLFLVCVAAGHLTDQGNHTRKLVSNIVHRSLENDVMKELWIFLAYTIANEIRFTACGFFKVDIGLITSTVSTGATYLVILAQFQIKR